jgi:hypothetical protein
MARIAAYYETHQPAPAAKKSWWTKIKGIFNDRLSKK